MKILSNIIWFIFGGLWLFLAWSILGLLLCITIVGIPFGTQCFKLASISAMPYGRNVTLRYDKHPIANILWVVFFGWELAIAHLFFGLLCCLTIIGIPRGLQCFKITKLALFPFGAKIQ